MTSAPVLLEDDFLVALQSLLPRGRAWPRDADAKLTLLLRGFAKAQAEAHARQIDLLIDAFPARTEELIAEWEASLGLPDPCIGPQALISERQGQIVARLTNSGGQSIAYYQDLAVSLGGSITVTEYQGWRWGVDHWWAPWRNEGWAHVWLVTLAQTAVFNFEWGISAMWEPYWQTANNPILCEIRRLAPGHTIPIFGAGWGVFSLDASLLDGPDLLA